MQPWNFAVVMLVSCSLAQAALGQAGPWPTFVNETSTRLVSEPGLGASDPDEKDYAWGDVDHDGDVDLVVARKQPFTTTGRRPNVLFLNESGVLTDRTARYASESSVAGDQGFLTPTNDRDVVLVDVDGDGWLDIVTATALSSGQPQHISHPRVYMNKGNPGGTWLGFRYEFNRIPALPQSPNFCGLGFGDVTGDGKADLHFTDYNSSLEDRLLINNGSGFFSDQSSMRMTAAMLASGFGTHSVIADMNGDGWADVVKSENGPAKQIRNGGLGFYNALETVDAASVYFVNVGELNGDGRLDIVITSDGSDSVLLNQGNGPDGLPNYAPVILPNSGGFGSSSVVADLNDDGWNDIIIADVDVDISGCSRQTHIYRNNVNPPNVSFTETLGGIPVSMLIGGFDAAIFDINGDGALDIVLGRCSGTQVWINQPPFAAGDLNHDGQVNTLDLGIMLSAWSIPPTSPGCGGAPGTCTSDLNHDGFVNSLDLGMLLSAWTL